MNNSYGIFFLFLIAILSSFCLDSCIRDDGEEYQTKDPFKVIAEASEIDEGSCRHHLPGFDSWFNSKAYRLYFKDSVIIDHVAQNSMNRHQWAYTVHNVPNSFDITFGQGSESLHFIDLLTNEHRLIDSADFGIHNLQFAGDHIVYLRSGGVTSDLILYRVSQNEKTDLVGKSSVLSQDGSKLKLSVSSEIRVVSLPDLEVEKAWEGNDEMAPSYYFVLWRGSDGFYEWNRINDQLQYYWYKAPNYERVALFKPAGTEGVSHTPACWINDDVFITNGGIEVNLIEKTAHLAFDTCASQYFANFTRYNDGKLIAHRIHYELDDTNESAVRSQNFHLLDPKNGENKRIEFSTFPR